MSVMSVFLGRVLYHLRWTLADIDGRFQPLMDADKLKWNQQLTSEISERSATWKDCTRFSRESGNDYHNRRMVVAVPSFPRKRESRSNADVLDVHDQLVLVRFWRSGIQVLIGGIHRDDPYGPAKLQALRRRH